ncbi:MAG: folate-binding protein [Propionibacteriaceae bacterium]|nr:folate-binding protein [Propionibacteriaceae bacterium]
MSAVLVDTGIDRGMPWHYGDPLGEQRRLEDGTGVVDLSVREVVRLTGHGRDKVLHLLGTLTRTDLQLGETASTYVLDAKEHIVLFLALVNSGDALWGWTEPGYGQALVDRLNQTRLPVEVAPELRPDMAVVWVGHGVPGHAPGCGIRSGPPDCLGGSEVFVPRDEVEAVLDSGVRAGSWAYTARRIAAGVPRFAVDTDSCTYPDELGVPYRKLACDEERDRDAPPRRLVRLHLDGSDEVFLEPGVPLVVASSPHTQVGVLGSMAYHYEWGPIGLGLVQREVVAGSTLIANGVAARVEALVSGGL